MLLTNGFCQTVAPSTNKPCRQPALSNGVCRHHTNTKNKPPRRTGLTTVATMNRKKVIAALLTDELIAQEDSHE